MLPPERRVPVEAIRAAARLSVEERSLRAVAREVGMSPMGLKHFIDGRRPYPSTQRKLNAWYVAHADRRGEHTAESAQAALVLLLDAIPESRRDRAAAALLDALARMHQESRSRPPSWLDRLRGSP